jgi:hypothetical protein
MILPPRRQTIKSTPTYYPILAEFAMLKTTALAFFDLTFDLRTGFGYLAS